jgi:glycosyltransferase involved in cell wall biosynthesis
MTTDRHRLRLLILIVAYEAEATIEHVLQRIPRELADNYETEVLVIDDASTDRTFVLAEAMRRSGAPGFPLHVLANPQNQGYGGNQKIGFRFALDRGFDLVALVHGDGQYAPECLPTLLQPLADGEADAVMGSRMMTRRGARDGGMPLYKLVGNRILTALQNRILRARLSEYHSGYRLYSAAALQRIPFDLNANGFHFDTEIIVQLLIARQRIRELPIPTYYGKEISRVKALPYGWRVLMTTIMARIQELGLFYDRKFDCRPGDAGARLDAPRLAYDSPHRFALAFIKPGTRVLLIGRGHRFGAELRERGCSVVMPDGPSPAACMQEREHRHDSLDADELPASLAEFDLVLLLDGVDRLRAPELFVDRLRAAARLAPQVTLIVSSANIGFIVTRLMLLLGQFNYGKRGILDMTHYRLFTPRTLRRLLEQGGFTVRAVQGAPVPFPVLLGDGRAARLLLWLNGLLLRLSKSLFAYQIIAIATPRLSLDYLLAQAETQSQHRMAARDDEPVKRNAEAARSGKDP